MPYTYPRELNSDVEDDEEISEKQSIQSQTSSPPNWGGVYLLSEFFLNAEVNNFNCMSWALGQNIEPVSIPKSVENVLHLLNEEKEFGKCKECPKGDYSDAKFMLFGDKKDVLHIAIKLTYDEIKARKKPSPFLKT